MLDVVIRDSESIQLQKPVQLARPAAPSVTMVPPPHLPVVISARLATYYKRTERAWLPARAYLIALIALYHPLLVVQCVIHPSVSTPPDSALTVQLTVHNVLRRVSVRNALIRTLRVLSSTARASADLVDLVA